MAVVLYYHALNEQVKEKFAWQMDTLTKLTQPLRATFNGLLDYGVRYSVVTFDDGFVSAVENALPECMQRGIPVCFFVPSGYLGSPPGWIRNGNVGGSVDVVVDEQQLLRLSQSDLVTIGSHCMSHRALRLLDVDEAQQEIELSKTELEQIAGVKVEVISFPHGSYDSIHAQMAVAAGYMRAFTISPTLAFCQPGEFLMGRINVEPSDWRLEFTLKLLGAYRWLPFAFSVKRKIDRFR